jgi:serine protease
MRYGPLSPAPRVGALFVTGVLALSALPGCELLDFLFDCDAESDPTCIDPLRAQVTGTVQIPEAGGAAFGFHPLQADAAETVTLRGLMTEAVAAKRAADGKEPPRTASPRRRVPHHSPVDLTRIPLFDEKNPVAPYRPAEVIVRAHRPIQDKKGEISQALSAELGGRVEVNVRLCGTKHRCLADLHHPDGKPLSLDETGEIVDALAASPLLLYAERNLILQPLAFPNDEFYGLQWHYSAIDLPAAWDITTGDADVVAAVIDTGMLFNHPDLRNRIVGGADLIDDPRIAGDGDGRDNDAEDVGDRACGANCHSHHGSHVGGTMGADTNNGSMIAGVTWAGGLLAVRTLGIGGGSLADIIDGVEWSIGTNVDGVSRNTRPADVINMSLGGAATSQAMNESVQRAINAGAIVVVAAGNDNTDARNTTPANAPGAITVASLGNGAGGRPARAGYSNFGNVVDIAAPGGDMRFDRDNDGNADGVLSTVGDFVNFAQGTSMAAPHVAGVAMLLKSLDRNLNQDDVRQILQSTSDTDIDCSQGCGTGQVNAFAAALTAQGSAVTGLAAANVRVGRGVTEADVVVRNLGDSAVTATFRVGGENRDRVTLDRTTASIPAKGRVTVKATIDRAADETGSATIDVSGGAESATARLDWTDDAPPRVTTVQVGAIQIAADGGFRVRRIVETNQVQRFNYHLFNIEPGEYLVIGLFDSNNDGDFDDPEDAIGVYIPPQEGDRACTAASCGRFEIAAGATRAGTDFLLVPGFGGGDDTGGRGDGGVGDACGSSGDCGGGLYCEKTFDPNGYCSASCSAETACPSGSTCFDIGTNESYTMCFKNCTNNADCGRSGYVCAADGVCDPA